MGFLECSRDSNIERAVSHALPQREKVPPLNERSETQSQEHATKASPLQEGPGKSLVTLECEGFVLF